MSRELEYDGWWEGVAVYSCDCCHKEERIRFDGEDTDWKAQRAWLRNEKGWITTKVNGYFKDFCTERCRNQYIRKNTL